MLGLISNSTKDLSAFMPFMVAFIEADLSYESTFAFESFFVVMDLVESSEASCFVHFEPYVVAFSYRSFAVFGNRSILALQFI